jgi:cytoskeletal protein CcmA (bactofilin family)
MWNKREDEPVRPAAAPQVTMPAAAVGERRESAVIGPSISIVGDVTGGEDLTILGKVEGKVALPKHSVTVGQSGRVSADIQAKVVSVAGEVRGNLIASEQIVIRKTATMLGNLTAPRVGLEDGCCFRGSVEMESPEKPPTVAIQAAGSLGTPALKAKPDAPLARP